MWSDKLTITSVEIPWNRCTRVVIEGQLDTSYLVGSFMIFSQQSVNHDFWIEERDWPEPLYRCIPRGTILTQSQIFRIRESESEQRERRRIYFNRRVEEELQSLRKVIYIVY